MVVVKLLVLLRLVVVVVLRFGGLSSSGGSGRGFVDLSLVWFVWWWLGLLGWVVV